MGITREQLQELIDEYPDVVLLDVSDPDVFELVHIPGSINIPYNETTFDQACFKNIPDKDTVVVIISHDIDRVSIASEYLRIAGYTNVFEYEGEIETVD